MTLALLGITDPVLVSVIVAAITALVTGVISLPLRLWLDTRLLRRRAATEHDLLRRKADVEWEFARRRALRERIGRYHGPMLAAVDGFSDRLENVTRHQSRGWLDVGGGEDGPWSESYYYRSTVTRFMLLMALVFDFEREAIFVDARVAERTDTRFVIYAKAIRWMATDVRLFERTRYAVGRQTDHFFTDELRRVCASLAADGAPVDLERLDTVLRGEHRLAPVMRYFDGLAPRTLAWDRLFALQTVLLAFMNDFGHAVQRSDDGAFASAIAQIHHITVVDNLRTWLPRIGGDALPGSACIVRALDARIAATRPSTAVAAPAIA